MSFTPGRINKTVVDKKETSVFLKQARDLFREGEVLLKKDKKKAEEKIQEALALSLKLIEVSPNTVEAYEIASQIFLRQGDKKSFLFYQKGYQYLKTGGTFPEPEAPPAAELKPKKKERPKESLVPIPLSLLTFPKPTYKEPDRSFLPNSLPIPVSFKNIQQTGLIELKATLKPQGKNKPQLIQFSPQNIQFIVSQHSFISGLHKIQLYKNASKLTSPLSLRVNPHFKLLNFLSHPANLETRLKLKGSTKEKDFYPVIRPAVIHRGKFILPSQALGLNGILALPQRQFIEKINPLIVGKSLRPIFHLPDFLIPYFGQKKNVFLNLKKTPLNSIQPVVKISLKLEFILSRIPCVQLEKPFIKPFYSQTKLKEMPEVMPWYEAAKMKSRMRDFLIPCYPPQKNYLLSYKIRIQNPVIPIAKATAKTIFPSVQAVDLSMKKLILVTVKNMHAYPLEKKIKTIFLYRIPLSSKLYAASRAARSKYRLKSYPAIRIHIQPLNLFRYLPKSFRLLRTKRPALKTDLPTKNFIMGKPINSSVAKMKGKTEILFILKLENGKLRSLPLLQIPFRLEFKCVSIYQQGSPQTPGILLRKGVPKTRMQSISPPVNSLMKKKAPIQLQVQPSVLTKSFKFLKMPEIRPPEESLLNKIDDGEHPLYLYALELDKQSDELMLEGSLQEAVQGYIEGGSALIEAGELQGAAEMLEKALKGKPSDLEILKKLDRLQVQGAILKPGIKLEIQRKIYGLKI